MRKWKHCNLLCSQYQLMLPAYISALSRKNLISTHFKYSAMELFNKIYLEANGSAFGAFDEMLLV